MFNVFLVLWNMDNIGDILSSSLDLCFLFKVETKDTFLVLFDDTGRVEIVTIKNE